MGLAVDIGLVGVRRRVTGNDDVGQREQFVIGGQRLGIGDIQSGAGQLTGDQGIIQRVGIHQPPAGAVDKISGILHRLELRRAEHFAGLFR